MDNRGSQDLKAEDRAHLDWGWQEDIAWLELSGGVPSREAPLREGWKASFERDPILWTVAALALGAVAFFLVTGFLF